MNMTLNCGREMHAFFQPRRIYCSPLHALAFSFSTGLKPHVSLLAMTLWNISALHKSSDETVFRRCICSLVKIRDTIFENILNSQILYQNMLTLCLYLPLFLVLMANPASVCATSRPGLDNPCHIRKNDFFITRLMLTPRRVTRFSLWANVPD